MSWKPEVFVEGKWSQNGLVFATKEEAYQSAIDLMNRWFLVVEARAVKSDRPANYTYIDHELKMVKPVGDNPDESKGAEGVPKGDEGDEGDQTNARASPARDK